MKHHIIIALMLLLPLVSRAQMQSRGPVQHIQSDGRIVSYVVVNPNHYAQTLDGYTLWHTATGDIVYAITDSTGQMAPSGVLAADQRTAEEEAFLGTIPKGLRFKSLPHMLTAGHLLGGSHFPHTATESDSLLVILVQFQDVQFSNTVATFDSLFSQTGYNGTGSFKDYYRDQSGGVFSPGVRVVGPITMPNNKNYYNQTSYLGSTVTDMVILAISQSDQQVDYSHYDNDSNGVVDAVLIFYAGESPSDKTQGLWPHRSTISGAGNHDGRTFSSYAIFDEGMGGMPTIGTACHEFGHCLGLPDLYDVAHDGTDDEQGRTPGLFSLMASGNNNSGGKLPPNLSVLEKNLLGWGAQFDTLQPGDSIGLRAIGTANDRAWYLPIDGDEFYAFEVRSGANHWDAGIGMGEGGLIVYHGKESKLNTTSNSVINCTVGDEGWYVVDAHGDHWVGQASVFGGDNPCSITPLSPAKPMKNDSTLIDSIWITNIRWTSDSTMAFSYSKSRPNYALIESNLFNNGTDVTDSSFTARALIIGFADTLLAKGVVYAATAEDCTMEQGIVVYDTNMSQTDSVHVTVDGITPGYWWFRAFVQDSNGVTFTAPQKVITPLVSVSQLYAYVSYVTYDSVTSDSNTVYEFVPRMTLAEHCSHLYGNNANLNNIPRMHNAKVSNRYDVSGPIPIPETHVWTSVSQNIMYTVWTITAVSTEGDTVCYRMDFSVDDATMIEWGEHSMEWLDNRVYTSVGDRYMQNGELEGDFVWTLHTQGLVDSCYVVSLPIDSLQAWVDYYGTMENNNSFMPHLQQASTFAKHAIGDSVMIPTGDSVFVMAWKAGVDIWRYQIVTAMDTLQDTSHILPSAAYVDQFHDFKYCTDSILYLSPGLNTHHYTILYGKSDELASMGVIDTTTAAAYCVAHVDSLPRYANYKYSYYCLTPALDTSEYGTEEVEVDDHYIVIRNDSGEGLYDLYVVPFDIDGESGEVASNSTYVACGEIVQIEPGVGYNPSDTTWIHVEDGHFVWRWHYDFITHNTYQLPMDSLFSGVFLVGELDSLMNAYGVDERGIVPLLYQQGLLNAYDYTYTDEIVGLIEDTVYEVCLWVKLKNEETGWADTLLTRKSFSTNIPSWMRDKAKIKGLEYINGVGTVSCSMNTVYIKAVFGTLGQLEAAGITGIASARDYIETGGELVQTCNISGVNYTSSGEVGLAQIVCNINNGQYYRLYAFPYDNYNYAGDGRMIGIDNRPESLPNCYTDSVTDITSTSANIQGHLSRSDYEFGDNYNGITTRVGFFLREASASGYDTIIINEWDTILTYTLSGLQPNTEYAVRAFYDHSGNYFSGRWSWGDITFYSGDEITFTTAQCTISATIDTTICYNAYYENQQYTISQTLHRTLTAVDGCDSLLSVNLTVLPQRIGNDTVVLCYGEEYDGFPRYNSFIQTETIQEEGLCDSTHRVRLEVLAKIETSASDTLYGDTYEWGNQVLTQPGQYTQVFTAANGCDSTVHLTLVAEPEEPQDGIGDVDIERVRIYVDGRTIVVDGSEGWTVNIYDAGGRLLFTKTDGVRYDAPSTGTYFVQVGNHPARKVVMVR